MNGTALPGVLLGVGLLFSAPAATPGQWPQWRGAGRDGSVSASAAPAHWPERLQLDWEREVGGGYSGPVVAGHRIWIHSRLGGQEVVSCLSLGEGETLWSRRYDAPFEQDHDAGPHGEGPYSTPAVAEGRLFTLGITSILLAWDAEDGDLLWRKNYSAELDAPFPYFGTAASPLVWGELCFVHFGGQKRGHFLKPGRGFMVAMSVSDGSERWRWEGDPTQAASPVIRRIGDRWQLVFKCLRSIVGLDPRTGELLWRFPYKVAEDNTIVTPLFVGERLVTSDWQKGMRAWRIDPGGGSQAAQELWNTREVSLFMSSPVISRGRVVGFSHFRRGQLFGLDPENGDVLWREGSRWGEHASLIAWGDDVLVFLEDGTLVVGRTSADRFDTVRRYRLGSPPMWGHPAVAHDRIVIRDGSRLAVFRLGGRGSSVP